MITENKNALINVNIDFNSNGNNKTIITELTNRLLFQTDENLQKELETLLKYDFNPKTESAKNAVLRLFNTIIKTPEFQLI